MKTKQNKTVFFSNRSNVVIIFLFQ